MASDAKAENNDAGKQSQPETVPSSDNKVPPPDGGSDVAPQNDEGEADETKDGEDLQLPEGVSERTRQQFDKLKAQLREAKEKVERDKVLKQPKPPVSKPQPQQPQVKLLYDPKTGLVDVEALNSLQKQAVEAQARAERAENAVSKYVEGEQTRQALSAYPELNPKAKTFDSEFHQMTRAILMDSMAYPETYGVEEPLSYKSAADLARKRMGKSEAPETPTETATRLTPKEQASLGTTGRPGQGVAKQTSDEELRRLQLLTRQGDKGAMIARMKNIKAVSAES